MQLDLEEWRYLASPFYDVLPRVPEMKAGVDAEAYEGNGLLITRLTAPHQMLIHDPATRPSVQHEYLLFERFYEGGGHAEVANTTFTVHPTRLHFIDMSRRYVSLKSASLSEGVLIPHEAVGYDPSIDDPTVSVDLNTGHGRLLATAHRIMTDYIREGHQDTEHLVAAFLQLFRRLMLRKTNARSTDRIDAPTKTLLKRFVRANLSDPGLDANLLAVTFGVSRAVLYRHFEEHGGVSRYIRNCRLDRCMFELAGKPQSRGRISRIARRWRFNDASTFNRLFKKRFGLAPSECLEQGSAVIDAKRSNVISVAHTWVNHFSDR